MYALFVPLPSHYSPPRMQARYQLATEGSVMRGVLAEEDSIWWLAEREIEENGGCAWDAGLETPTVIGIGTGL
jgi:hypothetical protein